MRDQGCFGGCLALIVGLVVIGLALIIIQWAGIPVGLTLAAFSYLQFGRYNTDPEGFDRTAGSLSLTPEQLRWACIGGMAGGLMLVAASVGLWVLDRRSGSATEAPSAAGIIPTAYRGLWAFAGDCRNAYSVVMIDGRLIDFTGPVSFTPERISGQSSNAISFVGTTHTGGSTQRDQITLTLSGDGQRLQMVGGDVGSGDWMSRCRI